MKLPLTLLLISLPLGAASSQAAPPNIVFILADDLGWHDVGYNGEEFFETPHIDRLAASGMRFDRAYSGGPNCLPTRACLLSGMYTPRTQMWTPGGLSKGAGRLMRLRVPGPSDPDSDFPTKLHLEPSVVSLAEMLKSAGYATARFGKWHVGPDTQGFDVSDTNGHGGDLADRFYHVAEVTRWLTDASLEFIERHRDRPFFVYLSHWDVHVPLVADSAIVEKYREKRSSGRWDGPKNPTYAAMIEAVDTSVGRVRDKLQALGIAENTLLVFSSDNGGQGATTSNAPLRGEKGSLYEGGIRVPTTICWPREIAAGSQCDVPITSVDFMPTFAEVAQATLPAEQPVDGQSLVPLWSDKTNWTDRAIFWHFPLYLRSNGHPVEPVLGTDVMYWRAVPSSAICRGDWKLIENFEDNSARLFNLRDDVGESTNLVARHPQVAAQLRAQLRDWRARVAAPVPQQANPQFDPVAADRFANPNAPLGPFQATGFKVGEVTPTSAIVWTRLTLRRERNDSDGPRVIVKHGAVPDIDNRQQPVVAVEFENRATVRDLREAVPGVDGDVRLRYRPRGIESDWRATAWRPVDALRDFTHQFQIAGLEPGTSYELQVDSRDVAGDRGQSIRGLFRTAPAVDAASRVVFTVSTGQGNDDQDRPDGFNIYPEMRKLDPDFFVHTGDIVYYDNLAKTLALARYHWQRTYSWPTNVDFHRHVASYFIKDDHDTWINDCWPTQSTPHMHDFTFRQGQAVFREQVPMGERTYRTRRWGRDLQVWLVEGRDFRTANRAPDGPEKTIWGAEQKAWLKQSFAASDATFRILISPTPIVGPDRDSKKDNHSNAAFAHEGNEIRQWLATMKNSFVVCGDRHWQYVSVDPKTGIREFSCGPASDAHAGGWQQDDYRAEYHKYLNVIGGFLAVAVERVDDQPTIAFRHYNAQGGMEHEERFQDGG